MPLNAIENFKFVVLFHIPALDEQIVNEVEVNTFTYEMAVSEVYGKYVRDRLRELDKKGLRAFARVQSA